MIPLERGQLWVIRIHALAVGALALAAGLLGEAIVRDNVDLPPGIVTIPLLVLLLYPVLVAPGRRYRAWGYAMDADELRIARGVWTRIETIVPLARVQHVDVSQGPIERTFGVCRLVLHTAGTMHSRVVLPGLARATAEALRDEVRGRIVQDAL
ncbi:PH domain-containing protein [Enterovirga sp. GCM10030262]|uniref:PH domain-containing protein n=1 Tax=Enterovirga sp. GCM10030262 TaxID=3273391 RepID=UPI0036149FDA